MRAADGMRRVSLGHLPNLSVYRDDGLVMGISGGDEKLEEPANKFRVGFEGPRELRPMHFVE